MKMQSDKLDVFHFPAGRDGVVEVVKVEPELVFFDSRGDVMMRVGIHVGVYPKSNRGFFPHFSGQHVDHLYFG